MAQVVYSRKAFEDLERLADFLKQSAPAAAAETVDLIMEAVSVLRRHPYLGRAVDGGFHELVISRGNTGYLALYRVERMDDAVLILSIRHQREAGFSGYDVG